MYSAFKYKSLLKSKEVEKLELFKEVLFVSELVKLFGRRELRNKPCFKFQELA